MEESNTIYIDGWRIDVESHRIEREGVVEKLEPRSMELLSYLAERPGQVVSRIEIEEQVWQGRVVSYEAVSGAIAKIRKAFGDTDKHHRVIETIPKSGYRLIAEVVRANPSTESIPSPANAGSSVNYGPAGFAAGVVLFVALLGFAVWQVWLDEGSRSASNIGATALTVPDEPSIAVLPFTNMSGDPEQGYFADGMTDDLITDLSKIPGLFVIARNSTFVYKNKATPIRQVAQELGVRYVMEGSVQKSSNQIRINAQLIDASSGGHVWAERYDGNLDDVFSMRDQITAQITTALSLTLADHGSNGSVSAETHSTEAYDAMLRGRAHYRLFTPEDLFRAIGFLENAIELDPEFARAHGLMAAVYWGICNNGWHLAGSMTYEYCDNMTSRHLNEAMKNPTPLAHRIAARQYEYGQRWDEALIEADKAIKLDPDDPNGYQAMSALLVNLGRAEEGLEKIKIAIRLDPQTDYLWRLGYAQFHMELYEEAAQTMYRATRRNPDYDWNYILLAAAYGHLGRETEARAAVAKFNQLRVEKAAAKPVFTLADLQYWSIKNEAGLKRLREGMSKAGVPPG